MRLVSPLCKKNFEENYIEYILQKYLKKQFSVSNVLINSRFPFVKNIIESIL